MIKTAIVGNIASGKSTVETILISMGFKVLDTDKVCHCLLEKREIIDEFCNYDIFESGKISRNKLGRLVFFNEELKQKLENLMYPMVRQEIKQFFDINNSEPIVFVSAPQLFEAGMEDLFDKILFIYCDDEIRKKRLIARNGYSIEYAELRMSKQISQNEKIKKSDWVIYNNTSLEDLKTSVSNLVAQIR